MDQVGRFEILDELGRGAHGVVYKALDPAIGRTVAIKSIDLSDVKEEDRARVREGILREARLAGTLSHPNIVTVYDVQDDGTSANIFMEYVDGKSLEWAISSTKAQRPDALSGAELIAVFRQVAGALDYAHRKGIVHRDIKPANIVITGQGSGEVVAKIADFGVAKFASPDVTQSLTGTPNYMSPEQVQGAAVSGASDQFSLAVIAYEVLCGRKAFSGDTIESLLYKIRNDREEPVDKVNPALSQTVRKVMQCALAKNPEQRFGTCSEFTGALEFALGDSPHWSPGRVGTRTIEPEKDLIPFEPPELEEEGSGGKRAALIAGLCLAVGLAIVLIVRMNSGPAVTTQVLDSKNGPISPPPTVEELKYDRHVTTPPLDLSAAVKKPPQPQTEPDQPSIVNVPVPMVSEKVAPKVVLPGNSRQGRGRKAVALRQARQLASVKAASPVSGQIQLLTDPPGANVTVDGLTSCTSPCSVDLAGGRHTLAASMDGFGVSRKIFYVPADLSVFIPMVRSQGVLMVSSDPSGANVDVDGKAAGTTPVTLRLTPGSHRVSVWDGARWHDESVQVTADEVHTRLFRF